MNNLTKYMIRWQLSSPILAVVPMALSICSISNFWITAIISNLIGSLIFFKVDKLLFEGGLDFRKLKSILVNRK